MNDKILVEACEGRHVPLHPNDSPNGNHFKLKPGDEPIEVVNSTAIRRRIRAGDLRIVTLAERVDAKLAKPSAEPAATTSEK